MVLSLLDAELYGVILTSFGLLPFVIGVVAGGFDSE